MPFGTGDLRFRKKEPVVKTPGPGYYADNNNPTTWKKKTFNILFAEI